jgi:HEAT repeat protein
MEAIRRKLLALATVGLLAATGCHHLPASWYYAWHGYPQEPMETPHDRVQAYAQLAETAGQKSPEEQERTAQSLADAFGSEEDPLVRAQIVRTLAVYPAASAAATLTRARSDSHDFVRRAACVAWGRRGGPDAVANLAGVLREEKNGDVRQEAVRALGSIADPGAVQALAIALEDNNVAIQHQAMISLESTTGKYFGKDVNAWRAFAQGQNVTPQDRSIAERVHEFIYR